MDRETYRLICPHLERSRRWNPKGKLVLDEQLCPLKGIMTWHDPTKGFACNPCDGKCDYMKEYEKDS